MARSCEEASKETDGLLCPSSSSTELEAQREKFSLGRGSHREQTTAMRQLLARKRALIACIFIGMSVTLIVFHSIVSSYEAIAQTKEAQPVQLASAYPWITVKQHDNERAAYMPQAIMDLPDFNDLNFNEWDRVDEHGDASE